jgi:hypothetical protein
VQAFLEHLSSHIQVGESDFWLPFYYPHSNVICPLQQGRDEGVNSFCLLTLGSKDKYPPVGKGNALHINQMGKRYTRENFGFFHSPEVTIGLLRPRGPKLRSGRGNFRAWTVVILGATLIP